jgi:hypothetical protein
MVYGHQQWADLKGSDWGTLSFLYQSVAMVKNRENQAAADSKAEAKAEADADRKKYRER